MNFNSKEWIENLIHSDKKTAMPVLTYPGLELTGKKISDLVTNGQIQAECIVALAKKYPSAAGVMVMDLSLEAEAFGAHIQFVENEVPYVNGRLLHNNSDIEKLQVPQIGTARTAEYIKAAVLASKEIEDKPVFGGIIGPYSLAGRLFDISEMMIHILIDPESAHLLLDKCTSFLIEYANEYKKQGVHGLIVAEPSAGLLSAKDCSEFSSEYVKRIVDQVQDEQFAIILHNCGNTETLVESMLQTGAAAFHFGDAVNMKTIMKQMPNNIPAFGNIEPVSVMKLGTPEMIRKRTTEMLQDCASFKNYIPSTGCDVPPGTPLKNVDAFFEAVTAFTFEKVRV